MRLIMEYMGLALISVIVGSALLYTFVTAPDSGLMQVGAAAEQEASGLCSLGTEQTYSEEELDQRIFFTYEEKVYTAGVYEQLAGQFRAVTAKGKELSVTVDRAVDSLGQVCRGDEQGLVFPGEGVYEVYVTAGGTGYMVTVPVMESLQEEAACVM